MAGAKVKNPRKKFNWQVIFVKHPINPYLFQSIDLPEITIEQVSHGDTNHDIKTAGRVTIGNLTCSKLETTSGSDTWLWDWIMACQDHMLGGGLIPTQYKETVIINELAEDGVSILNAWTCTGVWPTKLNSQNLDRTSSDNSMEDFEFSVDTCEKL